MGNYWKVKNTSENKRKFTKLYKKHHRINKNQFKDDFTHINTMEEIWDSGFVKHGVMDKDFY